MRECHVVILDEDDYINWDDEYPPRNEERAQRNMSTII